MSVMVVSFAVVGLVGYMAMVQASTVTVSATVGTTVTCNTVAGSTSFGTLTTSAVSTSSPNVTTTLACNSGAGCSLSLSDAGNAGSPGLYNSTSTGHLIPSADATLIAGTEGYGVQGSIATSGSGGAVNVASKYNVTGNVVGGLSVTSLTLASSTSPTTGYVVQVTHKAAIGDLTSAGSYSDTLTYGCTGN